MSSRKLQTSGEKVVLRDAVGQQKAYVQPRLVMGCILPFISLSEGLSQILRDAKARPHDYLPP